jgi:hypothetical protein
MSRGPQAAILGLAAVAGCSAENEVVFTISGDAPGAVVLFARAVDDAGSPTKVYSAGDADHPVKLPATIYVSLSQTRRVGVVVWLADGAGTIVAQGRTESCVELAASGKYTVTLAPAPDGWSPAIADGCRCDPAEPLGAMCPTSPPPPPGPDAGSPVETPLDAAADAEPIPDAAVDLPADGPTADAARDAGADRPADAAPDAARDAAPDVGRDAAPDLSTDLSSGADLAPVTVPSALFGFEMAAPDWTSTDTTIMRDTGVRTEGAASLAFTTAGTTTLRSRSFATKGLNATGTRISVDLFVNEQQSGAANTEMWVDCESASVFGVYLGYKALAALKAPAWTSLTYKMPPAVMSAFAGDFADCQVWFQLAGKGLFRYDRMGFAP